MKKSKFDSRFFESTRGRIVLLLKDSQKTVSDLAAALGLTDNAVRAHLLSLERDDLIEAAGTVKGFRKPHFVYRLTNEARNLFPKPYDSLFNQLMDAMKGRFDPAVLTQVLQDTGRRLARVNSVSPDLDQAERIKCSIDVLAELGGTAKLVSGEKQTQIKSDSCPFMDVVIEHPEVCRIAESMIEELVGVPVREACDRTGSPKCCFVIGFEQD